MFMLLNNFIVETNFPRHTVYLLDSLAALRERSFNMTRGDEDIEGRGSENF